MPEIYHIIKSLAMPLCLASALISVGIKDIKIFKRYFDYDADDEKSSKMEEKIEHRLLHKKNIPIEIRKDFQLHVNINRIVSLFRPREPEDVEDEDEQEEYLDEENEEQP